MLTRLLERHELPLIWTIDRSEYIDAIYRLRDGKLVLEPHDFQVNGWPSGQPAKYGPEFEVCFERGAVFHAAFDEERVAGVAVVDTKRAGADRDLVELKFLHVGHGYRGQGTGARLFALAAESARGFGAGGLYVSASETRNTVEFYLGRECKLAAVPDAELLALEPKDIHFEWRPRTATTSNQRGTEGTEVSGVPCR